jgi:hypothetical protein
LADSSISKETAFSILRVEEEAMWSFGSLHMVEFEVINNVPEVLAREQWTGSHLTLARSTVIVGYC